MLMNRLIKYLVPALNRKSSGGCMFLALLLGIFVTVPALGEIEAAKGLADLSGKSINPLAKIRSQAVVFIFVKVDCPISNRYVPLINSLATRYADKDIGFWLVYPDRHLSEAAIQEHRREYAFELPVIRDTEHDLVRLSGAKVTPQAAVFLPSEDGTNWGRRIYTGRIDNQYAAFGKSRPRATRNDLVEILEALTTGQPLEPTMTKAVGCAIYPSAAFY